jgi:hypothetical protein
MKTIETRVFTFDELEDKAKDKARDWYRQGLFDYDWYECTYGDAKTIGLKITEFDCYRRTIDGELLENPSIVCERVIANHGKACDTYKLAQEWYRAKKNKSPMIGDEFLKRLLEEYLTMLIEESEYLESNENVDENIIINEYTFTIDGKRFG